MADFDVEDWANFWLLRLLLNLAGYATVIVPGYLLVCYVRKSGYLNKPDSGYVAKFIRLFVEGKSPPFPDKVNAAAVDAGRGVTSAHEPSLARQGLLLIFCAGGLLTSYLIWGLLQERIMVYNYSETQGTSERFTNSQFLVFMNRIFAFCVAVLVIVMQRRLTAHQPPLYKYSYGSFSNIISSWCQYEALKFVSFPVQVLAKASKVIPVMLMGKLVSRRSYTWSDYVTAVAISAGLFAFLLTSTNVDHHGKYREQATTTVSGLMLLVGYLAFDSFTSNWQGELFRVYHMSSIEMMAGVNLFSVLLTTTSLVEQGAFTYAAAFAARHPLFVAHVLVLSTTSAVGQLFIFNTIAQFGPVTFTIIMTVRQGLAILLSCIVYHHTVTVVGILGVIVVFVAIFARIYFNWLQKQKKRPEASGQNAV